MLSILPNFYKQFHVSVVISLRIILDLLNMQVNRFSSLARSGNNEGRYYIICAFVSSVYLLARDFSF